MTQTQYVRRRLTQMNTRAQLAELASNAFEGYASLWNVPDSSGDIIARGAFTQSLRKRPPSDVRMLYQHFAHEPIGVWDVIREDARGLYVKGHIVADVERARDVAALLRDGALSGLSIGFRTKSAKRNADGTRTLNEIELWEISVVTFPMLAQSQVTAIGEKSLAKQIREAAKSFTLPLREGRIAQAIRGGVLLAQQTPPRKTLSLSLNRFSTLPQGEGGTHTQARV